MWTPSRFGVCTISYRNATRCPWPSLVLGGCCKGPGLPVVPCCLTLCVCPSLSRVRLFMTPWTAALQAPPSVGFSRQEYWSWLPFSSPGHHPVSGIEPVSPALGGLLDRGQAPASRQSEAPGCLPVLCPHVGSACSQHPNSRCHRQLWAGTSHVFDLPGVTLPAAQAACELHVGSSGQCPASLLCLQCCGAPSLFSVSPPLPWPSACPPPLFSSPPPLLSASLLSPITPAAPVRSLPLGPGC